MKVAIIGARRTRNGIGEYIARYFALNGAKVVAVLGTSQKTAKEASYNLSKAGIEATPYIEFDKMIKQEKPDAVVIASPSRTHYEYLKKSTEAGLSIFCEKPFIWPAREIEHIFQKARKKKLTVAMNSQWAFSINAYESTCGKIEKPSQFYIKMSPAVEGKEMIPEAMPHPLSILYTVLGDGEIEDLFLEIFSPRKICLRFNYLAQGSSCSVVVELVSNPNIPRDFSFGFNEKIITRTIELKNYDIWFNYQDKKVKIIDPLELSVKDFILAVEKKTEPFVGEKHILSNMMLLKKIYDEVEKKWCN